MAWAFATQTESGFLADCTHNSGGMAKKPSRTRTWEISRFVRWRWTGFWAKNFSDTSGGNWGTLFSTKSVCVARLTRRPWPGPLSRAIHWLEIRAGLRSPFLARSTIRWATVKVAGSSRFIRRSSRKAFPYADAKIEGGCLKRDGRLHDRCDLVCPDLPKVL
jgi:hypothetical protein